MIGPSASYGALRHERGQVHGQSGKERPRLLRSQGPSTSRAATPVTRRQPHEPPLRSPGRPADAPPGRLQADPPVDALPEQVGVAAVARVFLHDLHEDFTYDSSPPSSIVPVRSRSADPSTKRSALATSPRHVAQASSTATGSGRAAPKAASRLSSLPKR